MGVYIIAAGISSKNRDKTLDRKWARDELSPFLQPHDLQELKRFFPDDNSIYLWGANDRSLRQLNNVQQANMWWT